MRYKELKWDMRNSPFATRKYCFLHCADMVDLLFPHRLPRAIVLNHWVQILPARLTAEGFHLSASLVKRIICGKLEMNPW